MCLVANNRKPIRNNLSGKKLVYSQNFFKSRGRFSFRYGLISDQVPILYNSLDLVYLSALH